MDHVDETIKFAPERHGASIVELPYILNRLNKVQERINDVNKRMYWLKLSEKKPDSDGKYLVLNRSGNILTKYWLSARDKNGDDGFGYRSLGKIYKSAVLYWMPLPELPDDFDEIADTDITREIALRAEIKRLKEEIAELKGKANEQT